MLNLKKFILMLCIASLSACGGNVVTKPENKAPAATTKPSSKGGGYYLDDGPGDNAPANIDSIPDAVLKTEPFFTRSNKPYSALGQQYIPMTSYVPYKKQGVASWYGKRYHGRKTSTGEIYDMYAMSGAHTTLPLPSYVKVTNPANGISVIVRLNDRGPFKHDRLIDLSYAAAYKLRLIGQGSGLVEVEAIDTSAEALQKIASNNTPTPAAAPAETPPAKPVEAEPASSVTPVSSQLSANNEISNATQYYVQAGAFKSQANGELLQKKIKGLNLGENIDVSNVYNNALYRVKLGPYPSKKEADASAVKIHSQLNIPAIVLNQ
ncbi:RlpA-like protein precursor [mine drainage metagenome]|uniref:RlpA-like protein n=1 Tax=mine drainage metagenome TaxID=410659 RepID=A0A1J5SAE8_9ZZZZ